MPVAFTVTQVVLTASSAAEPAVTQAVVGTHSPVAERTSPAAAASMVAAVAASMAAAASTVVAADIAKPSQCCGGYPPG